MTGEEECLRESFLVSNALLRRALRIAAREMVAQQQGKPAMAVCFLIDWTMRACETPEQKQRYGNAGVDIWQEGNAS